MITSSNTNNLKKKIEMDIAKFIKDKTGKGPTITEVTLFDNVVICFFKEYLTKAEIVVINSGHPEKVIDYRSHYSKGSVDEIVKIFEDALSRKVKYFFPSWIIEKNLACWTLFID